MLGLKASVAKLKERDTESVNKSTRTEKYRFFFLTSIINLEKKNCCLLKITGYKERICRTVTVREVVIMVGRFKKRMDHFY